MADETTTRPNALTKLARRGETHRLVERAVAGQAAIGQGSAKQRDCRTAERPPTESGDDQCRAADPAGPSLDVADVDLARIPVLFFTHADPVGQASGSKCD